MNYEDDYPLHDDDNTRPLPRIKRLFTESTILEKKTPLETQVGGDHYKTLKIQPVEYIQANNLSYLEGNVIKYVTRHHFKNGVIDIDKAIHYLELIKELEYNNV